MKSDIVEYTSDGKKTLTFAGTPLCAGIRCAQLDLATFARNFRPAGERRMTVSVSPVDTLVLASRRLGAIELRQAPEPGATNLLEPIEPFDQGWRLPPGQSWRGLLLTWMLLSLGAPFWYDMFKDLLKLRPALAKSEEQHRTSRREDPTGGTDKSKKSGE